MPMGQPGAGGSPLEPGRTPASPRQGAALRNAQWKAARAAPRETFDYAKEFYKANPDARGEVEDVHHAIPKAVLNRYPGRFTAEEINGASYLRGIPNSQVRTLHRTLGLEWNKFYRSYPDASREEILRWMQLLDERYGSQFIPPVR